jgi:DMSO/TMAO reductase YedYZ molybdopterin-dependent catalytic subunit
MDAPLGSDAVQAPRGSAAGYEAEDPGGQVSLPPGQRPWKLERFGLPQFAGALIEVPDRPVVTVSGHVRHPGQFDLTELLGAGEQVTMTADLHCVTGWSALDLRWRGVRFADVHRLLSERVQPGRKASWLTVTGLDGYRSCLALDAALSDGALLATHLNDEPLTLLNGAPARLVVPSRYGYHSVRSVAWLAYDTEYRAGSAGRFTHKVARVWKEERSPILPGWIWRHVWRAGVPKLRRRYRDTERRYLV